MKSHGSGERPWKFREVGTGVVFEPGVLVFHPENIVIGDNVYIGHNSIIKGYFKNELIIGSGTWIGQQCFFHSAGGLFIGNDVGIGPGVKIITSSHDLNTERELPIVRRAVRFAPTTIGAGSDIGVGAVLLPGIELGDRVQVGAGAVVTKSFPGNSILTGVPARKIGEVP
tara:strand:- start:1074 stop:1583 length:510 start_codon:yes stop_codon:yes gene_type:complete